jgi:hypothetical protein
MPAGYGMFGTHRLSFMHLSGLVFFLLGVFGIIYHVKYTGVEGIMFHRPDDRIDKFGIARNRPHPDERDMEYEEALRIIERRGMRAIETQSNTQRAVISSDKVIESWGQLIENCAGRDVWALDSIEGLITEAGMPGVSYSRVDAYAGSMFGRSQPALLVTHSFLKEYRMFICSRDFGSYLARIIH